MPKKNNKKIYAAALVIFVASVGYLGFSGFSEGAAYFIDVSEALVLPPNKERPVRLFGKVRDEGMSALKDGVGVHFLLEDKNDATKALQVTFRGAVPDAFMPGAEVIVEGLYQGGQADLAAKKLMTQCPSKYRKKES